MERTNPIDFYRAALALFGGPNHGLAVGLITSCDGELLEILGPLPARSRSYLRSVTVCGTSAGRGSACRELCIIWCERLDGRGPRYAIPGLGVLADLVAEREIELDGGLGC